MFEASLLFADQQTENPSTTLSASWINLQSFRLAVPYVLAIIGLLWSSWGLWLLLSGPPVLAETQPEQNGSPVLITTAPEQLENNLVVDVSGAVLSPGIYTLKEGERVATAVELAGGITAAADLSYLQSTLNLASRVVDEQKIYVPFLTENEVANLDQTVSGLTDSQVTGNKLSINFATKSELVKLPKIGEVTAEKIIGGRPYGTLDELVITGIVTDSVWDTIKELVKL